LNAHCRFGSGGQLEIKLIAYTNNGADAETLIKDPDTEMNQAKENGRQGYQFFELMTNVRASEAEIHQKRFAAHQML
jgi:hypothetical protein